MPLETRNARPGSAGLGDARLTACVEQNGIFRNSQEAKFIVDQLEIFLEMDEAPSAGLITPFAKKFATNLTDGSVAAQRAGLLR